MSAPPVGGTVALNNGMAMPILGLGTWKLKGREAEQAVRWALELGYRHIDTASLYGNEQEVGRAIKQSGLPRDQIFVTTKLWPTNFLRAEEAFQDSLERLGLEYVDLYLIHWPVVGKGRAWKVLEKLHEQKLTRAIGVSNYDIAQLGELLQTAAVRPAVNQVEFSPFDYQPALLAHCQTQGIALEAYSPLTQGRRLADPRLLEIAGKYGRTAAQILLRWAVQHQAVVIPKSAHWERIAENAQIFDFALEAPDMARLDALAA